MQQAEIRSDELVDRTIAVLAWQPTCAALVELFTAFRAVDKKELHSVFLTAPQSRSNSTIAQVAILHLAETIAQGKTHAEREEIARDIVRRLDRGVLQAASEEFLRLR